MPASCCVTLNDDPLHPVYADEIQCQIEAIANLKPNASSSSSSAQTHPAPVRRAGASLSFTNSDAARNVKTQVLLFDPFVTFIC